MATFNQGILGGFSGKVGTVIGYIWKGIACMRGISTSYTNPNTPAQAEQRAKFSLVLQFLRPFLSFLRIGFASQAQKMTAFNAAMKKNLAEAVKGVYPTFEIDYPKVILSVGTLLNALNSGATSVVPGTVKVSWDDNSGEIGAFPTDTAMIAIYCPVLSKAVAFEGATRETGEQTITVPETFNGKECHVYLSFQNDKAFSNSVYAGVVTVAQA